MLTTTAQKTATAASSTTLSAPPVDPLTASSLVDPTTSATLAGVPGADSVVSTAPSVMVKNKPVCTLTDQTGPTGPVIPPLKPTTLIKGKPIATPTATRATTGAVGTIVT
jgi:hypothetical protein